jgi:serine/threonine protein kinase
MGEDAGRYFLSQMIDVLSYMQGKGVVHRDLKLENILVDDELNLKVADFGFATYKKINKLQSYRGTMTYMAPEIKEGKVYDGKQIDIFSTAVILFIIVQGIFPFKEAKKDEYFYNLLLAGKYEHYWKKVGGQGLSEEFKDLILRCFSYEGKKRPTIEEIKNHPWMQKSFSMKLTRQDILEKLQAKRSENSTTGSSGEEKVKRGEEDLLELVRQTSAAALNTFKFNDMTDFDIECEPGLVWEQLSEYNVDCFDSRLNIETNIEKKYLRLTTQQDEEYGDLDVKIKFFELNNAEEDGEESIPRYRVKFIKKRGDLQLWYNLFNEIRETTLEDTLL